MSYVEMDYAGAGAKSADKISFDNSEAQISGNPNNVQDAIEQINSNLTHTPAEETLVGTIVLQGVKRNRYRRVISTDKTITKGVFGFDTKPSDVEIVISITGAIYCSSGPTVGQWITPYWFGTTDYFFNHSWGTVVCQHSNQIYTGAFQIIDYCKQGE